MLSRRESGALEASKKSIALSNCRKVGQGPLIGIRWVDEDTRTPVRTTVFTSVTAARGVGVSVSPGSAFGIGVRVDEVAERDIGPVDCCVVQAVSAAAALVP